MSDTYEPTSAEGVAMHKLRRLVALSETFRCGCTYDVAWRERIHYGEAPKDAARPLAVIDLNNSTWERVASEGFRPKTNLHLYLACEPLLTGNRSNNDQRLKWQDWFGGVHYDIAILGGADDSSAPGNYDGDGHPNFTITQLPIATECPQQLKNGLGEFAWAIFALNVGDD